MRRHRPQRGIRIRPLENGDDLAVRTVFAGLSPEARRRRYLDSVDRLTAPVLAALVDVDQHRHVALVARSRAGEPVGLARYVMDGPGRAEIAYEVADAWQGRGIGSRLLSTLLDTARRNGVTSVHATVLADNHASLALLRRALPQLRIVEVGAVLEVSASLADEPLEVADLLHDLRAA